MGYGDEYDRPIRWGTPRGAAQSAPVDVNSITLGQLLAMKLMRRREQLALLEIWPDEDPFEDGTTLEFVKVFPNSTKEYPYRALRADGLWYLTGERSPNRITWEAFVNWAGVGVTEVYKIGVGRRTKVIG